VTVLDPFEGLPAHMLESIPLTVDIVFERPGGPRAATIDGEQKIMLDGFGATTETVTVQLERDGRKLTQRDRLPCWTTGEREGWRAWPVPREEQPPGELIDIHDAEEIHDAGD